jgi:3-hydroxyacyl-CoA dehydrogenase
MQAKGPDLPDIPPREIVILGAGFIGLSFAAAFRDGGWSVALAEPDAARRAAAPALVDAQTAAISLAGLARDAPGALRVVENAEADLRTATLVLECGPESLSVKRAIFTDLLVQTSLGAVIATASSAITVSDIVSDVSLQARCIVAHPVNPPSVLRVIELVPAPGTLPATCRTAEEVFRQVGFTPVTLGHEIEGFVLNRLQGAVLREAYRLVEEGVADVEGIDAIMRMGLGPRWALSGPFETAELNTPGGIRAHAARMGPAYRRMGEARGETVAWTETLVDRVDKERRAICQEIDLPGRAAWRANAVARLVALRDSLLRGPDA